MVEKQNFLESIAQCFSDLVLSYRAEQRLCNSEMFSAIILFYGLSQLNKIENRAGFCRVSVVERMGDAEPMHVFESPASSVDFGSVYRELAYLPRMSRTRHVRTALKLIHSWCQREWFRFFHLCRSEPLTVLQRAMVFQSFSYARFRAVVDLVTANAVVYNRTRLRGDMPIADLADLLMLQPAHCVELLETMGLAAQLSDDHTLLHIARPDATPYTTQEAIYRHLEDTGGKPRLCLPTMPEFFGFTVWHRAFELFPDELGPDVAGSPHADLSCMTCPVNLMQLLEPYCPPYNADVAALELTDAGNEWFADVQETRERMLLWNATHVSHHRPGNAVGDDAGNDDRDDDEEEEEEVESSWSGEMAQGRRRAILAAMDCESKSTQSSIFDDYESIRGSSRSTNVGDNTETTQAEGAVGDDDDNNNEEEEEGKALHEAKALLNSLRGDSMYAKMREELQKKECMEAPSARKQDAAGDANNAPVSHGGKEPKHEPKQKQQQQQQQEQNQHQQQAAGPWLSLLPQKAMVEVTPLPSDYPGEMSPSLRATVETPTSLTATSADDAEAGVVLQADGGRQPLLPPAAAAAAASFPFFPSASSRVPMAALQRPKQQQQEAEKEEEDEEEKNKGEQAPSKRRREEPASFTTLPLPLTREEKQEKAFDNSRKTFGAEHSVPLPIEKEESSSDESAEAQPRRLRVEKAPPPQQQAPYDPHGMRKVTFAVSSASSPALASKAQQRRLPSPLKATASMKCAAASYQDTVRAYLQRQRSAPCGSTAPAPSHRASLQQQEFFSSLLAEASEAVEDDAPQWMRSFTKYLIRFFAASFGNAAASRYMSEVLCGDPDAQASGLAGWICRGFTPTIVSHPKLQLQKQPPVAVGVAVEMPVLRLASTVVVFGSGMREADSGDDADDNGKCGGDGAARCSLRRSVVRGTLKEGALGALLTGTDPDAALTAATSMQPLSLGRMIAALLLPQRDGACLLARGAVYSTKEEEKGEEDDADGGEQIGLWEQLHSLRTAEAAAATRLSQTAAEQHPPLPAAAAHPRLQEALLHTQLSLYGVDCRDVPRLRWAAPRGTSTGGPVEHLTAVVALDATRRAEYEAGLDTLQLLVQHAAEQRGVFLAGVLVVLHAASAAEDANLQQTVEDFFWAEWRRRSAGAAAAAEAAVKEEAPAWRRAYQSTIRRTVGGAKRETTFAHDSCMQRRGTSNMDSSSTRHVGGAPKTVRGFFGRGDGHEVGNAARASIAVSGAAMQRNAPSPVFVVLPLRTAVRGGGRKPSSSSSSGGGDFTAINAAVLRSALLRAVDTLLCGYEEKWKEFLLENDMGARESVLRHVAPTTCK
ncbi:hypothetical protein DQ04_06101030 [Trypanosoma grayi]|uniref:hypothetical protein n=1 Tax=Trypanosoma grayi TaxID=71804 RepID=UPI0004F46B0F|nr:hypothetical protein DQ04_06101030 [Trypanosoma grayi]KEG08960.1 hypothetical protein DQ04_06101030 [Trypanosoma grayi]